MRTNYTKTNIFSKLTKNVYITKTTCNTKETMGYLAKLKTCSSGFEAQLLKGALMAQGIVCMLSNKGMTNVYGCTGTLSEAIDIMVRDADLDAAKEIVNHTDLSDNEKAVNDESLKNVEWSFG